MLEKKSYNRNSDDWWNHLMNSFEIYRNIPGILQTKYFWRFDNAPMFKAMWLTVKDPSTNLLTEALSTKKKNVMKYKKIYYQTLILIYLNEKVSFFTMFSKNWQDCFTHQHCHVESGNALARVHEPADHWDITFCTRWFWGF